MSTVATGEHKFTNRLAGESSPYLLQHAHNPVDWHPWGNEAFEKARRENKPIFLSVGYSTCYWCHVMERQSFENETIAAEMNRLMVNIKVDREERPDVDQLYMTAVQVQTRQGGWPMSVFLLPDLRYFYGGTYFPPTDAYGRPGFLSLIRAISDAYHNRRGNVQETSTQFLEILRRSAEPGGSGEAVRIDKKLTRRLVERSASDYDARYGGFGGAPKFPRETLLELLLTHTSEPSAAPAILQNVVHSLDAMADGGIRDQLGGGFHRYSTDAQWLVPHFEIMLYDNAMLGWCYAQAYRQTGQQRFAKVAQGVFNFILREMTSPEGAFYTAFDAEVDAREGLSYLWTATEIQSLLGEKDAALFNRVYGVDAGPNFADPHHGSGTPDKSILFLPKPLEEAAREANSSVDALEAQLAPMRRKLYEARLKRKQPLCDTKIITSWNALMIRALAHGGEILREPRYVSAAAKAAEFLFQKHRSADGGLHRTTRDGKPHYSGFLDDYAFFAWAMLTLARVTGEQQWSDRARELTRVMLDRFYDPQHGGFFFTEAGAPDMIVRQKTASDSPLPSGNAIAAMVLSELGLKAQSRATISLYAQQLEEFGEGMSAMVQATLQAVEKFGPFVTDALPEADGEQPKTPQKIAAGVVSVSTEWLSPLELRVQLDILNSFHIHAHDVADAGVPMIATTLALPGAPAGTIIDYPPGELQRFAFSETPLRVYARIAKFAVKFPHAPLAGPLQLNVTYQACNEDACLPPVTNRLEVALPDTF